MTDWHHLFVRDAARYIALTSVCLLGLALCGPRLLLRTYPPAIQAIVPPKTNRERLLSLVLGLPFILVLFGFPIYVTLAFRAVAGPAAGFFALWAYAWGIVLTFGLWDLLAIDWLLFCAITPAWLVIPGTERHPAYQDYFFHFKGFLIGCVFSGALGLTAATVAVLLNRG